MNKSTLGLSAAQLANGTPEDKRIILKSFYKGDRATISPAKDMNGRYLGIQENIPESLKLNMGYVPDTSSKVKIYDDIEIDLNSDQWKKDWEWMKHCVEIAEDYATGQGTPGAYFYIFRPGFESAKTVSDIETRVKLQTYILNDSEENLRNRASILGVDMSDSAITDVKEYLLALVLTEPAKITSVYESKTFSLELLFMHALKKNVIVKRGGVYTFGEILLGVEDKAVVAYFANPNNHVTTRAIEAVTYGTKKVEANPLENESVMGVDMSDDYDDVADAPAEEGYQDNSLVKNTLDESAADKPLTPQQKATLTRLNNLKNAKK